MVTGTNFWRPRSEPISVKEVEVLYPRTTYHLLVKSAASDSLEGKRLEKRKKLRASPNPSGYLV